MQDRRDAGMTLIELLIVLAIIAVIATLAIASLLRSRAAANEAGAIASVRVIFSAQKTFAATCGGGAYAPDLVVLGTPIGGTAAFVSADLSSSPTPLKSGFRFGMVAGTGSAAGPADCVKRATMTAFYVSASPLGFMSGARSFATNANGMIWQLSGSSPPTEPFGAPAQPIQ
jgi:prepilin-type N-terminal cleavage/methylation domain-containing protein